MISVIVHSGEASDSVPVLTAAPVFQIAQFDDANFA
jgi:hypothetical protein